MNRVDTPIWKDYFELKGEDVFSDQFAIDIAKSTAIKLMRHPRATKEQVVGLGLALYALQRLPKSTPAVQVTFGLSIRGSTEYPDGTSYSEMYYIDFHISGIIFKISRGGSVDMYGQGSDAYSLPGWHLETNGFRETECDLVYLKDEVDELIGYLDDNAEINVENETVYDLYRVKFR